MLLRHIVFLNYHLLIAQEILRVLQQEQELAVVVQQERLQLPTLTEGQVKTYLRILQ